jgi:hypothetical protein
MQHDLLSINKDRAVIRELEILAKRLANSFSEILGLLMLLNSDGNIKAKQRRRLKVIILECFKLSRELQARKPILYSNYIWPTPGELFKSEFHEEPSHLGNATNKSSTEVIAFPLI